MNVGLRRQIEGKDRCRNQFPLSPKIFLLVFTILEANFANKMRKVRLSIFVSIFWILVYLINLGDNVGDDVVQARVTWVVGGHWPNIWGADGTKANILDGTKANIGSRVKSPHLQILHLLVKLLWTRLLFSLVQKQKGNQILSRLDFSGFFFNFQSIVRS